jgi:hypothetical protein
MSDTTMERIRGANPFPSELPAPPIEEVWRRLEADPRGPRLRRDLDPRGYGPARLPSVGGLVAAIAVMTAVAIAVLAIVLLGHNRSSVTPLPTVPAATTPTSPAGRISAQLVRHFSVLRRTPPPGARAVTVSNLPAAVQHNINGIATRGIGIASRAGLDLSQIREVQFATTAPVWVIPGASGVCVTSETAPDPRNHNHRVPGTQCENARAALTQGVISVGQQRTGDPYQVVGIVPNGNTSVLVTFRSAPSVRIPVIDNALDAYVRAQPRRVIFKNAAGRQTRTPFGG